MATARSVAAETPSQNGLLANGRRRAIIEHVTPQCSPDHPWVKEHPEWFVWRPDGTAQYAENPPKKYQDIYPLDFESDYWQDLWGELERIVRFWIDQGVRIFRVDNPHTKPFSFWEWLIAEIKKDYPEVISLAEAFTRPKLMHDLAKRGFSQSYTYFAWRYTLDSLGPYFERVAARELHAAEPLLPRQSLLELSTVETPELAEETIGAYLEVARRLGQRTAEMHLALASSMSQPSFTPEPISALYQRSVYQSMRTLLNQVFHLLGTRLESLPPEIVEDARTLVARKSDILQRFRSIVDHKINASRIRCHGDYHLGQVLYTGKDFMITDFEGEPARPISERRIKRSPMIDVAGMLRSFHYAALTGLLSAAETGVLRPEDLGTIEPWVRFWQVWVSAAFLKHYLTTADGAPFIPTSRAELSVLLDAFLLEKAIYELGYELNNRPSWVKILLCGISQMLNV